MNGNFTPVDFDGNFVELPKMMNSVRYKRIARKRTVDISLQLLQGDISIPEALQRAYTQGLVDSAELKQ